MACPYASGRTIDVGNERPFLAPSDTFQRVLYALLALIGPRVLIDILYRQEIDIHWWILFGWWLTCFMYTVDWAIASYRKHRTVL